MKFVDLTQTVTDGSLLLAVPIALVAGLISFLSPCVLPLIPGYMSFISGVAGNTATRHRTLMGTVVFVSGFSAVFVSYGALFGGLGRSLIEYQRQIQIISGGVVIILGIGFLGAIPILQRQLKFTQQPTGTLGGAFLLGAVFGLGWTPCIGPTLAAVQTLALTQASATRGALLSVAYCAGLGIPFLILGQVWKRGINSLAPLRRHSDTIMKFGGLLLIAIGLLLITGYWNTLTINLRVWVATWSVGI